MRAEDAMRVPGKFNGFFFMNSKRKTKPKMLMLMSNNKKNWKKKTKQNKPKVLMENIQKYDQIALHQTPRNAQWHRKEK